MQSQIKPTSTAASRESSYSSERRTQALILETADALRAEQRRVNYATIDSNASKWRYSVVREKG
ncbi:MAG: hypothetical protein EPN73_23285 [Paraburkholderia sp.]|uniref:hypothetical protein n=1 Tax=Paraburkholderia sp. TaxID=1926495 RepID=UPI00120C15BF|nr:hypothetical protein [Paraburkholderia sp.]TAL92907.1 MAG: hypothetical protein EPN73_23285 [Paraburkholderia sp.]